MYKFAICPHCTETPKGRAFWEKTAQDLQKHIHKKIELVTFKDYFDETIRFGKEDFDIYYANPVNAYKLHNRGYLPLAKQKGKYDNFVLIGNAKTNNHPVTITTIYLAIHILPILYLKEFDFLHTKIEYVPTQREIYEHVKAGKVELGIMFEDDYTQIQDEDKPPVIKKMRTSFTHFVMCKPDIFPLLQTFFQQNSAFEIVDEQIFFNHFHADLQLHSLLQIKEFYDISKIIYEIPFVGIVIYRDRIIYSNEYIHKVLGYSFDEIKKLSIVDLVAQEYKEKIAKIVKRRLQGEQFSSIHEEIKVVAKNGANRYAYVFGQTILFHENYAGFIVAIDITDQKRYEKLYQALRNINKATVNVMSEEELYKIVCQTLVNELDISFVWVGVPDKKRKLFKSIYQCGNEDGYLQVIKVAIGTEVAEGRGQTGLAFHTKEVVINPDTRVTEFMKPWQQEMLKRGFLSSATIPIIKKGEVVATLNIYATDPCYFDEKNKTLLEELKRDLGFALEKIELIYESKLIKDALEKSSEWVVVTDQEGTIEYVNDYVCKLTGYTKEELLGKNPRIFKTEFHPAEFYKRLWDTILSGKEFATLFINRKKSGEIFYLDDKIIPIQLPNGKLKFLSIGKDITKERELLKENEKLRYFDILTDTYNFSGFSLKVDEYIQENPNTHSALIVLDIVNFSYINKTFSVEIGDRLLKEVANLLKKHFKQEDIIGRVGGDQFAIFVKNIQNKQNILQIIQRLKNMLDQETIFEVDNTSIDLKFMGGVAIYPEDGKSFKDLLQNASIALKDAKGNGVNTIKFFNKIIEEKIQEKLFAHRLIKNAIMHKNFIFHYQPYFDAKTKEITGFEALVRIQEDGTIHYPKEFIDELEHSFYLDSFRVWSLQKITQMIKKWKQPISLNISARSFENPAFIKEIGKFTHNIPAPLTIEVTERLYMKDPKKSEKIVSFLKKCNNIQISLDDFGTGYSSLSYLKDINADILKIDISFVKAMMQDKKAEAVVKAIIALAQELSMKTVAEGVETEKEYKKLLSMEVDYIQGYYFSKPLPEEEAEKLLS